MTAHLPVMPIWICAQCATPWPCPIRRQELRTEYAQAPISLALYLGSCLASATRDLGWVSAAMLHRRFLGWLR